MMEWETTVYNIDRVDPILPVLPLMVAFWSNSQEIENACLCDP